MKQNSKQIIVPLNIDYEKLFSPIEGKDSYKNELIDATYVVLSFLFPSENYIKATSGFDGFKSINNEEINKVIRNRFGKVKSLLMDVNSHSTKAILIEIPEYQPGISSMRYKLNEELFLNPGEKHVSIGPNAERRLLRFETEGIKKYEEFKSTYQFLLDKYESDITIDDGAFDYVIKLKSVLLEKVAKYDGDKDEMTKRVNYTIKEMNSKIRAIQKKRFRPSVSKSNHRLNSVVTTLYRELRYYLRINGNKLVEVDLKSSQPYVLGSILTNSFFSGDSNIDFSLIRIYPQLYNQLNYIVSKSTTDITSLIGNSLYNNKKGFPKYFMSGGLDNCLEIQSYRSLPFKEGFYPHLNNTFLNGDFETQKVKDNVMLLLNLQNLRTRNHISLIQNFKSYFPNINLFIESLNNFKKLKSTIAILMQRSESYLFLRIGCKAVNERLPDVPYLTIHDSILIEEQFCEVLTPILKESLNSVTGIEPGVSVKVIQDPMTTLDVDVEEIWDEILKM
ncbi:hypothetical protein [Flavobacterium sp.]|jgi:hypothetical protein|uniref:hypothetical protein n=1 Tax=Flavobacterium sp. TaxID=239 RepID=UPI0008CE07FD|nr:hypothetical protein [Flavobacterium sp.]OGS64454.1 MAG: hypothetical protein A2X21_09195 [Flavobacteria bacterium GWA2_35_26]HCF04450.1 hypothetical protein [Flavobacterium sp.]